MCAVIRRGLESPKIKQRDLSLDERAIQSDEQQTGNLGTHRLLRSACVDIEIWYEMGLLTRGWSKKGVGKRHACMSETGPVYP